MDALSNIIKGLNDSDKAWVLAGYQLTYSNAKSWFRYTDKKAHSVAFVCAINRAAKCEG